MLDHAAHADIRLLRGQASRQPQYQNCSGHCTWLDGTLLVAVSACSQIAEGISISTYGDITAATPISTWSYTNVE